MSSLDRPVRRAIYLAVLTANEPSLVTRRRATNHPEPCPDGPAKPPSGQLQFGSTSPESANASWRSKVPLEITPTSSPAPPGVIF
jgi:hypothetical protein